MQEGEPFSEEATLFTKELVLQREVGLLPVASYMERARQQDSVGLTLLCCIRDSLSPFALLSLEQP